MTKRGKQSVDSVAMRTRILLAFGSLIAVIAAFQAWYFPSRLAASGEQASGLSHVERAMKSVDEVAQGNASRAEELSATSVQMAAQAEALRRLVQSVRLGSALEAAGAAGV